jgi:hypothetical protein
MKPLDLDIFDKQDELLKELATINGMIEDRIDFILKKIWEVFGYNLEGWYVDGAEENELGDLLSLIHMPEYIDLGPIIYYCSDKGHIREKFNAILEGEKYSLTQGMPYRWLFEDFENELIDGKNLFPKWEADEKKNKALKLEKKKLAKLAALKSAKSKLSKEEIKALGI